MKKLSLLTAAFAMVLGTLQAQQDSTSVKSNNNKEKKANPYPMFQNRGAIGVQLGLPGFGLEYAHNLSPHLNARARVNYFVLNDYSTDMELSGQDVNIAVDLNALSTDFLLDYLPFKRSSFHITGGISFVSKMNIDATVLLNQTFEYGDIKITPEEIGQIDIGIDYTGIAPYIGFGFGRSVPKNRVGVGLEVGGYFAGGPQVDVEATGMLSDTSEEEAQLEENLSDYAWVPRASLRISFKLGKDAEDQPVPKS